MKKSAKEQRRTPKNYLRFKKMENLVKSRIKEVQDWPQKGVNFKDITPLLQDKEAFSRVIDFMASPYIGKKIDKVVGIDARGFILAAAIAYKLNAGLAIVRKKGKLPRQTVSKNYSLEYGDNEVQMHSDSILPGEKVLLIDDVLATGGTIRASADLVEKLGGEIVSIDFLIELSYLKGREKISNYSTRAVVKYLSDSENREKIFLLQEKPLKIGIIGGSGFYDFFKNGGKELDIETEFGRPSDKITTGIISGREVYFLPRHGKKHQFPPHKIPYKANISAFKKLGVDMIIAPSAVGSLRPDIKPGDFVICDQFINRTSKREDTFFDGPEVSHIESAYPYCPKLRDVALQAGSKLNFKIHPKGTVVVIEGPRFSTLAESMWFSKMGWDLVNMTQYPEVALASELGICYLNISLVTDYDAGIYAQGQAEPVSIGQVLENFKNNNEKLKTLIFSIIESVPEEIICSCQKKAERAKI